MPIRKTVLFCLAMVLFMGTSSNADEKIEREVLCPGMWYQSETCTMGAMDGCASVLKSKSGSIQGSVKSPWVRRVAAVVYIEEMKRYRCKAHPASASSSAGKCTECGAGLAPVAFALPPESPVMDQKNLVFMPHVLPVMVGTKVKFPNSDTVRHNVYCSVDCAEPFNLGTYGVDVVKDMTFNEIGVEPLSCNVHSEMEAFIIILANPYFALTDKKGGFTIKNVPVGTYQLTFWHEKLASKSAEVTVKTDGTAEINFAGLGKKK